MFFGLSALVMLTIGIAYVPEAQAENPFAVKDPLELFKRLDANRDQRLSEQEFVGEKGRAGRAKARKRFRMFDENGDQLLSLPEFKKAAKHD